MLTINAAEIQSTFVETENPELNHILKTIQDKIILPAHLPKKQRQMVFNVREKAKLEQNPIILEIEGLEHKFAPIDRFNDVPNSKTAMRGAIDKMETPEDWKNLPILLAGYKQARVKLNKAQWAHIVRLACSSGNASVIMECAKQADATGLDLSNHEVTATLLSALNAYMLTSGFDAAETAQSIKFIDTILDLLLRPHHAGAGVHRMERPDNSRVVRGLVLFARASAIQSAQQTVIAQEAEAVEQAEATQKAEGEAAQEAEATEQADPAQTAEAAEQAKAAAIAKHQLALKDEVNRIVALWGDAHNSDLTTLADVSVLYPRRGGKATADQKATRASGLSGFNFTRVIAQNIKAMQTAQDILGSDASQLQPIQKALDEQLQKVAKGGDKADSWAKEYEAVVGTAPKW